MARYGSQFGPDITFLGVPRCDIDDPSSYAGADVVIVGAPFDGGTSYRSGARFGPQAVRQACYLDQDGSRPSLAMRVDALRDLRVLDMGDVEMFSGDAARSCRVLEAAVERLSERGVIPLVLGGDHTVTWPDASGVARGRDRWGRIGVVHFDAHADTANIEFGALIGHGQPMRRLIESGAVSGEHFVQIGLRGYWPSPTVLNWMAEQGMRSYDMAEIGARGLGECLDEAMGIAARDCDGIFLSVDIDVCDPAHAPGTGTPEPGGLSARELLDAVRRVSYSMPIVGADLVEVSPPFDASNITAFLGNRVCLEILAATARRRRDAAGGPPWQPGQPLLSGRPVALPPESAGRARPPESAGRAPVPPL